MSQCHACDAELLENSRFCISCGVPRNDQARDDTDWERCEIVWWRGYVKSGFCAVPTSEHEEPAAEPLGSPLFRTKRGGPPVESGAALVAHDTLVARLLLEGWELAGRGPTWYANGFRRKRFSPAPEPLSARSRDARTIEKPAEREQLDDEQQWAPTEVVPQSNPDQERPSRSLWRRARVGAVFLTAGTVGIAAAVAPSLLGTQQAQGTPPPAAEVKAKADEHGGIAATPTRAPKTAAPRIAHVTIAATRGDSWLEARVRSPSGRVLYSGVLAQGQTTNVSARTVWLRLAAAAHLDVLVNGKAPTGAPLMGTLELVLRPGSTR